MNNIIEAIQAQLVANNDIPKPRFILEVSNFMIRDVANEQGIADDLDKVGFGIISYTWGRFQNKAVYEDSKVAPKFDQINRPGPNQIWWYIPKMNAGHFSIDDVVGIVQKLNMKYVWWDWACIPQSWDSGGVVDPKRRPQIIGTLPQRFQSIVQEEVAKQFYIYTLAKKGFIWLHDIEFLPPTSRPLTDIQTCLQRGQYSYKVSEIDAAVLSYQRMKAEDNWLSSMWTFQEGILLNTDDVINPRDDRLLSTRNNVQFARLVDKKGKIFTADTCFRGDATLLDITGRATLLACEIANLVIEAIGVNDFNTANTLLTYVSRLYETGLVGVAADSPLDVLEAAKARGGNFIQDPDYCVNAILGALRVVLPPLTPSGDTPLGLAARKRALMATLTERNGWKMIILSKPTLGTWSATYPNDPTAGNGDWSTAVLGRLWNFSSLGIFITTNVGRSKPRQLPVPGPLPSPGVGHVVPDNISIPQLVPYTNNVLLMGALQVRDNISLPPLRHAKTVEALLGLPSSQTDAMVIGPEDPEAALFGNPPPYGFMAYNVTVNRKAVPMGPKWTSCRFYASQIQAPPGGPPTPYPVKLSRCYVKPVDYTNAFGLDGFGPEPFVLLPIEDVSVYKGTIKGKNLERVVVLRCVILRDFRSGTPPSRTAMIGGGIFLGIGDFTFAGNPQATTLASVLGPEWMIYMY
ncbi:hypothetical protein QBC35DRAFT_478321 [Podospora australis]|uniref:Heterokaryon incompatibility domain-containing protein n=1 Tax=Podospora australis TaxID=1536484 RepID=A0AAN6WK14_9PEZI|nr:hypothetical protein QBC35DRAFT_478321 [Podospora australis]